MRTAAESRLERGFLNAVGVETESVEWNVVWVMNYLEKKKIAAEVVVAVVEAEESAEEKRQHCCCLNSAVCQLMSFAAVLFEELPHDQFLQHLHSPQEFFEDCHAIAHDVVDAALCSASAYDLAAFQCFYQIRQQTSETIPVSSSRSAPLAQQALPPANSHTAESAWRQQPMQRTNQTAEQKKALHGHIAALQETVSRRWICS